MPDRILHFEWPRLKHEENSPQGDLYAVHHGYNASDHDATQSASGRSYNNHWPDPFRRDGFYDPEREYGPGTSRPHAKMRDLPDHVVERLVAHSHGETYHIRTTVAGIRHAASVGLDAVYVETKPGNTWRLAQILEWKRVAKKHHIRLVVMAMDSWKGWRSVRRLCRVAGVTFRQLHMPGPVA